MSRRGGGQGDDEALRPTRGRERRRRHAQPASRPVVPPVRLRCDGSRRERLYRGGVMPGRKEMLEIAGREVAISNPEKIFFPELGLTKIDLVRYYLAVAEGALRGIDGRPMALKRFVNGADGEFFFQKRAPSSRPDWIETVELKFPSGRTSHEVVIRDAAQLAWIVNLGCIDLNPHPVRADDLDHPDEFRVDLDPVPGVGWGQIVEVAIATREVLEEFGLTAWPKTSGSRGVHVYARIERRWTVPERFERDGDPWAGIDDAAGSLEPLLELSAQHEAAGFADAPWPPQYEKQANEPPRVQPSKKRGGPPTPEGIVPPPAPGKTV